MNEEKINYKVVYLAIIIIGILEGIALFKGINGTILALAFTLIGTLAGVIFPKPRFLKKG